MGNSPSARRRTQSSAISSPQRRPSFSSPPIKADKAGRPRSSSHNHIDDRNFAPRKPIESDFPENSECPICFLNYEDLNVATCCKQLICTDCYLLVKHSALQESSRCSCPFCSTESLNVVYTPRRNAKPAVSDGFNLSNGLSPEGSSSSISSSSTCSRTDGYETTSSYGADIPLKVVSVPSNINVPLSSINDRKDIETAIQQQRLRFADDQPPPVPSSSRSQQLSRRYFLGNGGSTGEYELAALRLRIAMASSNDRNMPSMSATNDIATLIGNSMADRRMTDQEAISYAMGRASTSDLERIEEMMMMEAIRQSIASSPSSSMSPIQEHSSTSSERLYGETSGETFEADPAMISNVSSSSLVLTDNLSSAALKSSSFSSENETSKEPGTWSSTKEELTAPCSESSIFLNGNLSDCESDVGVSVMAWEEALMNDELAKGDESDDFLSVNSNGTGKKEASNAMENIVVGVKSESCERSTKSPHSADDLPIQRMHSRNRSPGSVPRPLGGRFSDASVHINQCSAVAEILEKREKNGEMTEFGSTNLLETIDIALGRVPGSSSYRSEHITSSREREEEGEGDSSLFDEHCDDNDDSQDETGLGSRMGAKRSNTGLTLRDRQTGRGDLNASSDDALSAANHDDVDDMDGNSSESSTQYSEEKEDDEDEDEEEEVIMLSVVLNPADSPFSDSKTFDSSLDCPEAISPIYL